MPWTPICNTVWANVDTNIIAHIIPKKTIMMARFNDSTSPLSRTFMSSIGSGVRVSYQYRNKPSTSEPTNSGNTVNLSGAEIQSVET